MTETKNGQSSGFWYYSLVALSQNVRTDGIEGEIGLSWMIFFKVELIVVWVKAEVESDKLQ